MSATRGWRSVCVGVPVSVADGVMYPDAGTLDGHAGEFYARSSVAMSPGSSSSAYAASRCSGDAGHFIERLLLRGEGHDRAIQGQALRRDLLVIEESASPSRTATGTFTTDGHGQPPASCEGEQAWAVAGLIALGGDPEALFALSVRWAGEGSNLRPRIMSPLLYQLSYRPGYIDYGLAMRNARSVEPSLPVPRDLFSGSRCPLLPDARRTGSAPLDTTILHGGWRRYRAGASRAGNRAP